MKNETIQSKATQLKLDLEEGLSQPLPFNRPPLVPQPVEIKLSHCHELIAATFGYGQRVSIKKMILIGMIKRSTQNGGEIPSTRTIK